MVNAFQRDSTIKTAVLGAAIMMLVLSALTANAAPPLPPDPSLNGPPLKFIAELASEEESHVVHSPASGFGDFTLDRETMKLSWRITYDKMTSAVTGAHVHGPQTPGGNAGVLFPLAEGGIASPIEGSFTLSDGLLEYFLTGRVYVNIHTEQYKDGELRAPIMRVRTDSPQ